MSNSQKSTPIDILLKNLAVESIPFLRLNFQNDMMLIEVSIEGMGVTAHNTPIGTHTVFELERLSEGLRYVTDGRLPDYIEVPSKEGWIGSDVVLTPALWTQLGLVVGKSGRGVMVYVSRINSLRQDSLIEIEATCNGFSAVAKFDTELILEFADKVYSAAKLLI